MGPALQLGTFALRNYSNKLRQHNLSVAWRPRFIRLKPTAFEALIYFSGK
jgi:hypothetical protein